MSEKCVLDVLQEFGLSRREAEAYIFLSKKGAQDVHSVSANLKMDRVQTYRTLKSLQEKGVVEATIESPTRFTSIPFETLVQSLIRTRKSKLSELETQKDTLIAYWKSLSMRPPEFPLAKFRVITEQRAIYEEIANIIKESQKEILQLATSSGVIQEDVAGTLDQIVDLSRKNRNVHFKILTNISKENFKIVEQMMKRVAGRKLNVQWRHADLGSKLYPQFVIKDREETLLYVTSKHDLPILTQAQTGLLISSTIFVSTLTESFMEMWRVAVPAEERITELKTGKPIEQTAVVKDAREAEAKLEQALQAAEKDVVAITSSDGLNRLAENGVLRGCSERGLKVRIMAPIDLDNLEAAKKLAAMCQVRHVPISYLMMLIVDGRSLFMFKTPPLDEAAARTMFHLEDVFYSNDARYLERVSEMLDDTWKRGLDINEMMAETDVKAVEPSVSVSDTALKVVDLMLKNSANSVIVTDGDVPVGIVSQRDLLEKILKPKRKPEEALAKEVMSIPVVSVESDQPIMEALKTMRKTGIRRVAVFKKGKLVAMLT